MSHSASSADSDSTCQIVNTSNNNNDSSAPKPDEENVPEQEALVEPKEAPADSVVNSNATDDRQKAKQQVEEIVNRLKKNSNDPSKALLTAEEIIQIIIRSREALMLDSALIELEPPIVIVGDLHGQFSDAIAIFEQNGWVPDTKYLFLGDYVDRGDFSTETSILLLGLKLLYPDSVFLLRGNHECKPINKVYGFYEEVVSRYSVDLWEQFQLTFNCLPICARISNRIFCMHGGLSRDLNSWQMFAEIRRPIEVPTYGVICDLLWADPTFENVQFAPSARGISCLFGEEYVIQFCKDLNLDIIVRGHQVVMDGYEFFASRRMVTIFSAPYYCKEFANSSAVLIVSKDLECRVNVRYPKGIVEDAKNNEEEGATAAVPETATPFPTPPHSPGPQESHPKSKEKTPATPAALPKATTPKKESTASATAISSPKSSIKATTSSVTTVSPATTPKKSLDEVEEDSNKKKRKQESSSNSSNRSKMPSSATGSSEKTIKKPAQSDPTHSNAGGTKMKKDVSIKNLKKKKSGSARQVNDRSYKRQKVVPKKVKSDEKIDNVDDSEKKPNRSKMPSDQKGDASESLKKTKKESAKQLEDSQKKVKKHTVDQPKETEKKNGTTQNRSQTPGPTRTPDKTKK